GAPRGPVLARPYACARLSTRPTLVIAAERLPRPLRLTTHIARPTMTSPSQPPAIEVDTIGSVNAGDRRGYSRYPLEIGGEVAAGDVLKPCIIRDFSGTGMSLSPYPAAAADGAGEAANPAQLWRPGEPVQMMFVLPRNNVRVRAQALVRRITRHGREPRLGVTFDGANPDVFEALIQISDRSRLNELSQCSVDQGREEVGSSVRGWEAVACYVGDLLDTCFHRSEERLHLKAHYATPSSGSSKWYFALLALKSVEATIRNAFVRNILDGVYAACPGGVASEMMHAMTIDYENLDDAGSTLQRQHRTDILDGLNDRAMLQLLAQGNEPLSPWIGSAPEAPVTPAALFKNFKDACMRPGLEGDNLDLMLRTFREAVALHWPFTRRVLQAHLRTEQLELQGHPSRAHAA
ncbi:MAG: PilZ domain-containing protein, partial [Gammaproteobacteria bacterium]